MNPFNKILMISVAVVFDIIEFVLALFGIGLILNRILTVIEYCIFFVWFSLCGVSFMGKSKKLTYMGVSFIS